MGKEPSSMDVLPSSNTTTGNSRKIGFSLGSWLIWIVCFVISLLPIIVISFLGNIINVENMKQTTTTFDPWMKIDIFYVCASMGVSAIIEIISNRNKVPKMLTIIVLIVLIIGIMISLLLYGALYVSVNIYNSSITDNTTLYSKIFLSATLVFGSCSFIKSKEN